MINILLRVLRSDTLSTNKMRVLEELSVVFKTQR